MAIIWQIMRKELSMFLKKMSILNEKSQRKSTDQGMQQKITLKKYEHPKRFQVGQKNSIQGINRSLSGMLENPENPFLKFNFLVKLMFQLGPYGGLIF